MTKRWFVGTATTVAVLVSLAFVQAQEEPQEVPEESTPVRVVSHEQPIAFPHDIHAGQDRIPCMYCHFSAERSVDAGIPPVQTCNGCHQVIQGSTPAQQSEIAKVRQYWADQEQIPWVRIYKVSDHVNFPHMRHIEADVDCTECHGQVQEMGVLTEVEQPLGMGWCLTCHVERDASRDCAACHY